MDNRRWISLALKVVEKGKTGSLSYKLSTGFKNDEFIFFCQKHEDDMLQFVKIVESTLLKFVSSDNDQEQTDIAMNTVLLAVNMISALKAADFYKRYPIVPHCLSGHIVALITRYLNVATETQKRSIPKKLLYILKNCEPITADLSLFAINFNSCFMACIVSTLSANKEKFPPMVQFLVKFFDCSKIHDLFTKSVLHYLSLKKKVMNLNISGHKVPAPVALLVAFIQCGFNFYDDSVKSYKTTFAFAAHFICTIAEKIEEPGNSMTDFFSSFIRGVLSLLGLVDWPGARLLFYLIQKKLLTLIHKKINIRSVKFALKQLPAFEQVVKSISSEWENLKERLAKESIDYDNSENLKHLVRTFFSKRIVEPLSIGDSVVSNNVLWTNINKKATDSVAPLKSELTCHYKLIMLSPLEAAAVAFFLDYNHINYTLYAQYVLSATFTDKREVKAAAIKSIGEMFTNEPEFLLMPKAMCVIDDCLSSGSFKEAIAKAMQTVFTAQPSKILDFLQQFLGLLQDPDPKVRSAAINSLSAILKDRHILHNNPAIHDLLMRIIRLIEDDDISVHAAVLAFFKKAWLDSFKTNVDALIIACLGGDDMVNHVESILNSLQCQQKSVCMSQLLTNANVPESKNLTQHQIGIETCVQELSNSLANELRKEDIPHENTTLSLLRAIAKVTPSAVGPHVDVILDVLKELSQVGKRIAVETLRLIYGQTLDKDKCKIKRVVKGELLENGTDGHWEIPTLAEYLKIFKEVEEYEEIACVAYNAFSVLDGVKITGQVEDRRYVKWALCVIYVLGEDNDKKTSLLTYFGKMPEYKLTLLSVSCQVRLDCVPVPDCPFFDRIVTNFLDESQNEKFIAAGLYFIYCTLQGYKQHVQQSNDIKCLDQTTTEAVSNLLQKTLNKILNCAVHKNNEIRRNCCAIIKKIAESGLILMPRLLPYICAMSADPLPFVNSTAKKLLKRAAENWDISLYMVKGIAFAYQLLQRLNTESVLLRGFDSKTQEAAFSEVYKVIQESPEKRRKFWSYIAVDLLETKEVFKALYIADQIANMSFHYVDELFHVLSELNRLVACHAGEKNFSLYLLKKVRSYLTKAYKIGQDKLSAYTPPKAKSTATIRQSRPCTDYLDKEIINKLLRENGKGPLTDSDTDSDLEDSEGNVTLADLKETMRQEILKNDDAVFAKPQLLVRRGNGKKNSVGMSLKRQTLLHEVPKGTAVAAATVQGDSETIPQKIAKPDKEIKVMSRKKHPLPVVDNKGKVNLTDENLHLFNCFVNLGRRVSTEPKRPSWKKVLKVLKTPMDDLLQY